MTNTSPPLTLEQIGRLAGVSRSTVSRVLNDHKHVRPDVRARVEAVIEETGYLPNQAARALVSNRTGVIGLVMPTGVDELFGDPYYSALVHGIQEGCSESGSILSIFPFYGQQEKTHLLPTLLAQGFLDGVIVTAGTGTDWLISTLRDRGKNMVVVGHPADDRDLRRVDVENRVGSASAVDHLHGLGHRRIGFIGPTAEYIYGLERLDGYRDALSRAGRAVDDHLVRFDQPTADGGYRAAVAILPERPDALHVATDTMARGVLRALHEHGVRVPDDVAVVSFDGIQGAPRTEPSLTTIVQPVGPVGRMAVRLLRSGNQSADVMVLPTIIRIGESCGALAPQRTMDAS